jgi:methylated-DNA-[protein]-cysteine S-methyltransferase
MPITFSTPLGPMTLHASAAGLSAALFADEDPARLTPAARPALPSPDEPADLLALAAEQLTAYFAGSLRAFTLPLAPPGTPFQHQAWAALSSIPFGQTRSYAQQAAALGRPSATRAVARANAQNPLGIIVPCHRVIGRNGSLTGYGGGLERKAWLLQHEAGLFKP